MNLNPRTLRSTAAMSLFSLLAACGTTGLNQAPVVDRNPAPIAAPAKPPLSPSSGAASEAAAPKPAAANPTVLGRSYTVKRGDTLYAIALEQGLSYRDIATWNGITNPNYIQADQVLRLTSPDAANPPVASASVATAVPIGAAPQTPAPSATVNPPVSATGAAANNPASGDIVWAWPAKGKVSEPYTEGKSKGVGIAGAMGEPVYAAADGVVVYAGSALKGYGPMLIIKHNETYITAYAHNSKLFVKEEQAVKRGQTIAEIGNAEVEGGKPKLHFELRRNGKPLDPVKLLPSR